MKIKTMALSVSAILATLLLAAAPSAATAAPSGYKTFQAGELISSTTVPMVPLCESLEEETIEYIVANNLNVCGYGQAGLKGGASTDGYATGICGNSAIFLYNGNFSGQARINYGFTSTAGTIAVRSLVVSWDGASSDGSYTDFTPMSAVGYNNNIYRTTGVGLAAADLSGTVLTSYGLWCVVGSPFDQRTIS